MRSIWGLLSQSERVRTSLALVLPVRSPGSMDDKERVVFLYGLVTQVVIVDGGGGQMKLGASAVELRVV